MVVGHGSWFVGTKSPKLLYWLLILLHGVAWVHARMVFPAQYRLVSDQRISLSVDYPALFYSVFFSLTVV